MCTLTYIPGIHQPDFVLTSNRDEATARKAAVPPVAYHMHGQLLYFPKDAEAGGTWIAHAAGGYTLCLLNGAFEKHIHRPPYTKSRGIVLLDFFKVSNPQRFASDYDFTGIEPFTLVFIKPGSVCEMRWDEHKVHYTELSPKVSAIWSSAMLYEPGVIKAREQWFHEFLEGNPHPDALQMLAFHRFGGDGSTNNSMLMNRHNRVRTLSITCLDMRAVQPVMRYFDVLKNNMSMIEILP